MGLLRKARVFLSVYYAYMVEYRAELLLWMLANSLPLIMMGVWIQAAQDSQISLSAEEFARYFIAVFFVRQLTVVWVAWEFEKEVVEGKLSPRLLQPMDPVWHHVAGHVAERFARLPFSLLLVGLFFMLYPQAIWLPSPLRLLGFTLLVTLAFILHFLIQYTFALCAFWTERATSIDRFWYLFYTFLAGMVAPLDVFPDAIREAVMWTPFPALMYFPVSVLIGLPINVGHSLAVMLGWMGIFWVINRWLWKLGLKQYSGMGA